MQESLVKAGLTSPQANAYLLLLEKGSLSPPQVATQLQLTRSNAYKVLEQLMELGLAIREEKRKKFVFSAGDPSALNDILARERNKVIAIEKAVKQSQEDLTVKYRQQNAALEVKTYHGSSKLIKIYEDQANLRMPIYFIKSRHDIPTLGYEEMSRVRSLPSTLGTERFAITPDVPEAPCNPEIDAGTNLTRTWIDENAYTAPVEWSVSGDEVTIFVFEKDGAAVKIKNQAIADSLQQIYTLLDSNIRDQPQYIEMPRKAQRSE